MDRAGALVLTDVPLGRPDPLAIGGDERTLVIVSVPLRGTGSLLTVSIGEDGALTPSTPAPLREVVWGWPEAIRVEGDRALLDHTTATEAQTRGPRVRYTIDLRARRVTSQASVPEEEVCRAFGCVRRDGNVFSLGERRLDVDLVSTCPTWYSFERQGELVFVAPGAPWRTVRASGEGLREIDVAPSLAPVPECGTAMYAFPAAGILDGHGERRRLLRYDGRVFGVDRTRTPRGRSDRGRMARRAWAAALAERSRDPPLLPALELRWR